MSADDDAVYGTTHLSAAECWEVIRGTDIGRLGVIIDGHPEIFPINYTVDRGTVVFRTGEGTKLNGVLSGNPVAFEVDGYDPDTNRAWSALIKGTAEIPRGIDEIIETTMLPIFPWQAGIKSRYVRIVPTEVSGRRFHVQGVAREGWSISDIRRPTDPS